MAPLVGAAHIAYPDADDDSRAWVASLAVEAAS